MNSRHVVIPRHGPPDVLEMREIPLPVPAPTQIRIAVQAAGVNFADVLARMGLYPDAPRLPFAPGYEVVGVVDAVGGQVARPHIGERVLALTRFGGYATHVVVDTDYAFTLSPAVSDNEAVALPVNYLTAYLALYRLANVSAGETVLLIGAGGGVGIAAIQLARLRRARVIGAASERKHHALRALGVDQVLDYRQVDLAGEVRRLTDGRGVDVVLDPVGGKGLETSYRLLAPLGRLVTYGVSAVSAGERRSWWRAARAVRQMPSFRPISLMNHNRGVFGLNLAHLWDERRQLASPMQLLLEELSAGRLRPLVDKTFPLDDAASAHRFIHARANIGKVILTCP